MAFRVDKGSLRPATRLADGRLRVDGRLTRSGVFVYRDASGKERREYRPPAEVFHRDALDSFALAPLTDDHPPESISASNARQYAVGTIGEHVRVDGDHVTATLMVFDAATIAKMDAGKVQLSCGYLADVLDEPGVSPEGERYDAVQTRIRGNHVALVDVARAGPAACVRMDAAYMVDGTTATEEQAMPTIEELQAQLAAEKKRGDALEARIDAMPAFIKKKIAEGDDEEGDDEEGDGKKKKKKDAADRLEARADALAVERDQLKAQLASAEQARADAAAAAVAATRARVQLEATAARVLGPEFKVDDATDRAIKVAIVKRIDGADVPEAKSDEYVAARFDAALERDASARASLGDARALVDGYVRADAATAGDKGDAARARMIEHNRNAWKSAGTAGAQGG